MPVYYLFEPLEFYIRAICLSFFFVVFRIFLGVYGVGKVFPFRFRFSITDVTGGKLCYPMYRYILYAPHRTPIVFYKIIIHVLGLFRFI